MILTFVLLSLALGLGAGAQAARFVSESGRFSVEVPGRLQESSRANETPLGTVEEHIFRWTRPGLEWVVNYSDLPGMAGSMPSLMFLEVRHGFRRTTGQPVRNEVSETFLGYPARRFEFQLKPQDGRPKRSGVARVVIVEGRLYVLTVTWDLPELPSDREAEESFVNSFSLLKS